MPTVAYTRTTVARNPVDTASPGTPTAQPTVTFATTGFPISVRLMSQSVRGEEVFNLTVGEQITITVS